MNTCEVLFDDFKVKTVHLSDSISFSVGFCQGTKFQNCQRRYLQISRRCIICKLLDIIFLVIVRQLILKSKRQ